MKRNIKFFTIVISLHLLSFIILTGCMYAIVTDNVETKSYDPNGQKDIFENSDGNIIEDSPLAQTELQKKFNAYLHKDGELVTIFSEEQFAELKAVRENGERIPLTYEEIIYLINDSIDLYFTYGDIRLTNAKRDNITPIFSNQSVDRIIFPKYRDTTIYEIYYEAQTDYLSMLTDIYEIIYYRIYMHDAGFETVYHNWHNGSDNIFGNRYDGHFGMISSAVPQGRYQMLAVDDATFSGIDNEQKLVDEYKTLLEWKRMYEADTIIDYEQYPYLNSAVLYTGLLNTNRQPMEYKFYIAGPKNDPTRQIYPTAELEAMMPHQEFYFEVNSSDNEMQPTFSLNYENGRVAMSAGKFMSFAMVGTFDEHDGVLKMNFGDEGSYVFYKEERGYVYSAENSKPVKGGDFDFADGLVFETVHEGVSMKPITQPDNKEPHPAIAEDYEQYYPDELFDLYDLSKIVTWDQIYAAEEKLLKNNANSYNEQLPHLYLMIKELAISKEHFVKVADDISEEQIEWLFADVDDVTIMKNLKADWAFYYEGRLYNIFELAELDKDLIIELRECGALDEFIAYMDSLNVEFEALEFIKNAGK